MGGPPNMFRYSKPFRNASSIKPNGSGHRHKQRCKDTGPMVVKPLSATKLIMGQVKILKRGEEDMGSSPPSKELQSNGECDMTAKDSSTAEIERFAGSVFCSTNRLGPDPSSVPIPTFASLWKKKGAWCSSRSINHVATKDVRHLSGLDIVS